MNKNWFGIACAILGAGLWGFSGSCMQYLFSHSAMTPLLATAVRMLGAGVLFGAVIVARQRASLRRMLADRSSLGQLIVFGSAGLFLCQVTFMLAVSYTNAGTATVMQGLNMVFVLGASCVVARRFPGARELLCVVLAFGAIVAIATKGDLGVLNIPMEGLVWGLLTAVTAAFYIAYPRRLFGRWGSVLVTGCGMLIGGVVAAAVIAVSAALHALTGGVVGEAFCLPALDAACVAVLVVIVVAGTFGAFGLYLHGVALTGPVTGSLLGAVEPVSATVISAVWLGTLFTWADWLGLALMVATIVLISLARR